MRIYHYLRDVVNHVQISVTIKVVYVNANQQLDKLGNKMGTVVHGDEDLNITS